MLQATGCDGGPLDAVSFGEDHFGPAEVDVGRCEVVDALVIANVIIVLDKVSDLALEISG